MISSTSHGDKAAQVHAKLLEAVAFQEQGALPQAEALYREILKIDRRQFDALHLLGVISAQKKGFEESVALITKAIAVNPNNPTAYYNRAIAWDELHQHKSAVDDYNKAIQLKPDHAVAYNNRGIALTALKRHAEAISSFDEALQLQPTYAEAYNNRGNTLSDLGRFDEAIADFDRALQLRPDYPYLYGLRLYTKARICDWRDFDDQRATMAAKIANGEPCTPSWPALSLTPSLSLERKAAATWAADKHPSDQTLGNIPRRTPRGKIRVGYFSMDFRAHPVASLITELIETHDRDRFEIHGFSYGPDTGDDMRKRLAKAFDRFIDVRNKSDHEIAATARRMGIDIAIDLAGFTTDARTGIFAARAAPIQVNYLGYPATMAAPYMDYIIGDDVVIPVSERSQYAEKVVSLPETYMASDSTRGISERTPTRVDIGLPEDGVVFCCFNNSYKITPRMLDCWTRILSRVEGSVLWLSDNNAAAKQNLMNEAATRGIAPQRLIFAERLSSPADHLARHRCADLFLDTLPFNAHTTANDALWAGLPVLTCVGETFAGRAAASLLKAANLSELVTKNLIDYEDLAVALGINRQRLAHIRLTLAQNRRTTPLFDTKRFALKIENAYTQMYARYTAGLAPDHITVAE